MRVILLTHGGADLVIEEIAGIAGIEFAEIFIETDREPQRGLLEKLTRSLKYDGVTGTISKLARRNGEAKSSDRDLTTDAASRHGIPITYVDCFHSPAAVEKMRAAHPDLGVIFGTNIIKESVYSIPRLGSVNLHQGMAPFYRGGPPVFWELFNGEREVGLTVHFVAAKVDSGDIIFQETVPLSFDPSYGTDFERFIEKYREGLRKPSARAVGKAVAAIASGRFDRAPQDASLGKRYRLPTKKEKDELRRRLRSRFSNTK
jgi:methionyl-tRNA formyltransferase